MTAPTQFVEEAGIRFGYRRFGKPGGVPLVFNILDACEPLVPRAMGASRSCWRPRSRTRRQWRLTAR
jgi:hypothetical protein